MRQVALWIFGVVGAATCSLGLAVSVYALIERWRGYSKAWASPVGSGYRRT